MILFVEKFANVKRFGFETFITKCKLLNKTKKNEKAFKHSIYVDSFLFQISVT